MRPLILPLLLLTATATPGWAQENCLAQVKFPAVGRWVEYKALYNKKDPYTVRYAVIGSEQRGGKKLDWVELRMTGENKDRNMVYQMLVPGSITEMGNVQDIVFKTGDHPAMKLNGMMMKMIRGQLEKQNLFSEVCKDVSLVGKEKVAVPAGQFEAQHYHSAKYSTDSWMTPSVPFSLVKSVGENHQMELTAQGNGAKSSITEQPQEMPGMGGPTK
jgi:hypothetical protein